MKQTYLVHGIHATRKNIDGLIEVEAHSNKQAKFKAKLLNPQFKNFKVVSKK